MFKGYWYIAVALGLILFSLSARAHDGPEVIFESQPDSPTNQNYAKKNLQEKSISKQQERFDPVAAFKNIESVIRALVPQKDKIADKEKEQREKDDLTAQEWMAIWTGWMFGATIATVIVTTIGLWLIRETLKSPRVAAGHAEEMVNQGRKTVEVMSNATALELQPYIHIREITVKYILTKDPDKFLIRGVLKAKNVGQTPAYDIRFDVNIKFGDVFNWNTNNTDVTTTCSISNLAKDSEEVCNFDEGFDITSLMVDGEPIDREDIHVVFSIKTNQQDVFTKGDEWKLIRRIYFNGAFTSGALKRGTDPSFNQEMHQEYHPV